MRQLHAIQPILAKAILKARELTQRVLSLQLALGEIAELDPSAIQAQ